MTPTSLPKPADAPTKWVPIAQMGTHPSVNRPVNEASVNRIVERFDPALVGVVVVAEWSDPRYIIIDGQHRVAAMRRMGWDDQSVEAKVYKGLSIPQMAAMFVGLNDSRHPHAVQIFLKREIGGDPVAVGITRIVNHHGLKIEHPCKDGHVSAVAALEHLYQGFGRNGGADPSLLAETLSVVVNAWGRTHNAVRGEILTGLGLVLARDRSLIDTPSLIQKLSTHHGGAAGVTADAKQLREIRGGSLKNNVADVVIGIYNRGRRTRRLPDWRS